MRERKADIDDPRDGKASLIDGKSLMAKDSLGKNEEHSKRRDCDEPRASPQPGGSAEERDGDEADEPRERHSQMVER